MKPPTFRYHAPTTVAEALDALAEAGEDGKVLAGGQSLIPLLNMRLAAPGHLVDINRVDELDTIAVSAAGVRIGARVRYADVERHAEVAAACPLLADAVPLVAHPVIRNRGTVVGSVAHADPAGEVPAVLALLGGTVHVSSRGAAGTTVRRDVAAADFFVGTLTSALRAGELVEAVTFPAVPQTAGTSFAEVARRHGDYALCGVGAVVDLDGDGVSAARVAVISVGPVPAVVDLTQLLRGRTPDDEALQAAAEHVRARIEPDADIHAKAGYRRHLAGVLTGRAVRDAVGAAMRRRPAA